MITDYNQNKEFFDKIDMLKIHMRITKKVKIGSTAFFWHFVDVTIVNS